MNAELARQMKEAGFDEVTIDGLGNVIGRIGSGPRVLAIDAHIDTVDVGNRANWTFDPFAGDVGRRLSCAAAARSTRRAAPRRSSPPAASSRNWGWATSVTLLCHRHRHGGGLRRPVLEVPRRGERAARPSW